MSDRPVIVNTSEWGDMLCLMKSMTVRELRTALRSFPDDAIVYRYCGEWTVDGVQYDSDERVILL